MAETIKDPFADITITAGTDSNPIEQPKNTTKDPAADTQPKETKSDEPKDPASTTEVTPPADEKKTDDSSPKDPPATVKDPEPVVSKEFETMKADYTSAKQRVVALERELAFYKQQEQEITADPKAWIQQNAPSLLEPPLDIDKELEKEFGAEFRDNEYVPNDKAGSKSFKYDMRRYELYDQQRKSAQGGELPAAITKNKTAMTEGIATIDSVVTELQTKFKVDEAYIRKHIEEIHEFCKGNPWKASAMALKAKVESDNLTLERAKELVAKDELLRKEKGAVTPTPSSGRSVVVTGKEKKEEKDDSGFGDMENAYKKYAVM